jgi:hypothetical protein
MSVFEFRLENERAAAGRFPAKRLGREPARQSDSSFCSTRIKNGCGMVNNHPSKRASNIEVRLNNNERGVGKPVA